MTGQWVEIEFDCLPLRSVTRLDVPVDASPVYEQFVLRVKEAMEKHGSHNAYYLHHATCVYHLTNDPAHGTVCFEFEGTVLTGEQDRRTKVVDISKPPEVLKKERDVRQAAPYATRSPRARP